MLKKIVSPELAAKLKEKGFDEPCLGVFQPGLRLFRDMGHKDLFSNFTSGIWTRFSPSDKGRPDYLKIEEVYLAPLYQDVTDWLREKHKISTTIIRDGGWWIVRMHDFSNEDETSPENHVVASAENDDYYPALAEAIEEALYLIHK